MSGRVVLFGAAGYTGELTARAMVARELRSRTHAVSALAPGALAGRSRRVSCACRG